MLLELEETTMDVVTEIHEEFSLKDEEEADDESESNYEEEDIFV